jgi:PAS domain S-box-containing protein
VDGYFAWSALVAALLGAVTWACLAVWDRRVRREEEAACQLLQAHEAEERQRAAALAAAEAVARAALAELAAVYDTAPVGLCVLDAEMRWTRINARMAEMNGLPPDAHVGRTVRELLPGVADAAEALHRRVMASGEPVLGIEIEGETPARPGVRRAWVESWLPLRDAEGRVAAINVVAEEVTERRAVERQRELLMREVDHRAKNALAVVQAALRLTPMDNAREYVRAVEGRVAALARAHSMLAEERWEGAPLRALVEAELVPFLSGPGGADTTAAPNVEADGPPVTLAPTAAQALATALHELATNATKHGALSAPQGRVAVSWWVDWEAGLLRLRWAESRGPPVAGPPARRGLGSRVLDATIRGQLGGAVERRWERTGLVCELAMPLTRVLAHPAGSGEARSPGLSPA